ncbi:type IV secretion system protein [Salmonella enterica]|uniref:type IV secretion system protein n=1 Tax=Escherichia coli TaxID=562 RepID=UPI0010CC701E|nr:type IV secretion system protein [Escherichia coli]EBG5082277.1 type IV secretion system protein VirB5 [Salmonella enterica subsp. enterica serovar Adelaide]EEJ5595744.1 type IV secretion system protein VirB5 [Salmonella enterica subsp. enterica serovar 4,[5],12:i:-]EJI5247923.1 type IV secretion system protein [Salmonella enterica]EKP7480332.1 type IV secretion system protein [Salmonella enterica subsp. enterica serovar Infantis]EFB3796473.1 type IV secretion system protein VirB5 [Escheric
MKRFRPLILAVLIASPTVNAAGIPVFDATARLENIAQWAKEAQQWLQTVQHYKDQLQAYQKQLETVTGIRDIQAFVNQAKSLKADLDKLRKPGQALNDLLLSGGSSGQFDELYNKYKIFDNCNAEQSKSYANTCRQEVINKAIQIEQTNEVQTQIGEMLGEINELSDRVANAKDMKEAQDLANSIQLKSVMLNTLTTQWEMNVKAAEKREKMLAEERRKKWNQQQLNAPEIMFN